MSKSENEVAECPFSGNGEVLLNVKFFRGNRNDVIAAEEIIEQAHSAKMQVKMGTATLSRRAPVSAHPVINVREFVSSL